MQKDVNKIMKFAKTSATLKCITYTMNETYTYKPEMPGGNAIPPFSIDIQGIECRVDLSRKAFRKVKRHIFGYYKRIDFADNLNRDIAKRQRMRKALKRRMKKRHTLQNKLKSAQVQANGAKP